MYLFFDTETTGLPKNWKAPASNVINWPRMVQLACGLYTAGGELLESRNFIIKPVGYTIPREAAKVHRITTERALAEGVDLSEVLEDFSGLIKKAKLLVAHNMAFDEKIVGAEYHRVIGKDPLPRQRKYCTMKDDNVIDHCQIEPFRYGSYKWPTLSQLHQTMFGKDFSGAHDADADIKVTDRCFFALKQEGIIRI